MHFFLISINKMAAKMAELCSLVHFTFTFCLEDLLIKYNSFISISTFQAVINGIELVMSCYTSGSSIGFINNLGLSPADDIS